MARKTIILGQNKLSYSKAIMQITGWTKKEFETQKRLMRYRVSNFNKATGSNLSAIEELFYKVRFEDKQKYYAAQGKPVLPLNALQQALQDIKTTHTQAGTISPYQMKIAREYIEKRYEGLAKAFTGANNIMEEMKAGKLSPAEANLMLSNFADNMRQLKDDNPMKWIEAHQNEDIGSPDDVEDAKALN